MALLHIAIDGIIFENQQHGGISRLFRTILPLMCDQDPDLRITMYLAGSTSGTLPRHPQIGLKRIIPLVSMLRPGRLWKSQWGNARALALGLGVNRRTPSIWHSTYYTQPVGWSQPKVVTVHDLIHEKLPHLFQSTERKVHIDAMRYTIQQADTVLCVSHATSRDLQSLYGTPDHKIRVIHHAASSVFRRFDQAMLEDVSPTSKPYLLYVGAREKYKNFAALMKAYSRWLLNRVVDLVVVGAPWSVAEEAWIQESDLGRSVYLLNQVDDGRLAQLYSGALAFVYPSLAEGFGIPLLEAMTCGCPIVASQIPSSLEVAVDYPIYFDPYNVDSLIAALDTAYTTGRSESQYQIGLQLASKYSWKATAAATLNAYYEVLGKLPA